MVSRQLEVGGHEHWWNSCGFSWLFPVDIHGYVSALLLACSPWSPGCGDHVVSLLPNLWNEERDDLLLPRTLNCLSLSWFTFSSFLKPNFLATLKVMFVLLYFLQGARTSREEHNLADPASCKFLP